MKNRKLFGTLLAFLLMIGICIPVCFATSYDQVASSSDMTTVEEVGVEGMEPIGAKDVENGTYDVEMESSSSMFKIAKAELNVTDDAMTVEMTLNSTAYPYLYAGTAKEAAALNDVTKYIAPEEDADGHYVFTVPVNALDEGFSCAAFSKNKEKWYDRTLLVKAQSLPEGVVKVALPDYEALEEAAKQKRVEELKEERNLNGLKTKGAEIDKPNGTYSIEVDLAGGTGKASITSPTTLMVMDGRAYATIQWSSPNYDYMIVEGEKLEPQNVEEGSNSSFLVPILKFDEPMTVIADTTAMSKPHEIEYQLTFHRDSVKRYGNTLWWAATAMLLVIGAGGYGFYRFWTKK